MRTVEEKNLSNLYKSMQSQWPRPWVQGFLRWEMYFTDSTWDLYSSDKRNEVLSLSLRVSGLDNGHSVFSTVSYAVGGLDIVA